MRCPACRADNPDSNRFCGDCGRALVDPIDGEYGSTDPAYPDASEEPYVVWKWPYAIWGTILQTRIQFVVQTTLVWILFFVVMSALILRFGLPALIAVLIVTVILVALLYAFWKAGREAAKELNLRGAR